MVKWGGGEGRTGRGQSKEGLQIRAFLSRDYYELNNVNMCVSGDARKTASGLDAGVEQL